MKLRELSNTEGAGTEAVMLFVHKAEGFMLVLSFLSLGLSLGTSLALLEIPSAPAHHSGSKD